MSLTFDPQRELIQNLQAAMQSVRRETPAADPTQFRTGLKSIADHLLLMQNYTCTCGQKMSIAEHRTYTRLDGIHSEDVYSLRCTCGADEKINFRMMTKYLKEDSSKMSREYIRNLGYI